MEETKKYFIFSDVHSYYTYLKEALDRAGFDIKNPNHIVISCGDIFDRGSEAKKMLNFITKMIKQKRAICIRGNHEILLKELMNELRPIGQHDIYNGTIGTIEQISGINATSKNINLFHDDPEYFLNVTAPILRENKKIRLYFDSLVDYYELGNNIFVHGWVPIEYDAGGQSRVKTDWKNSLKQDWYDAVWLNGMAQWVDEKCRVKGKTVYCGHWNTSWGHKNLHHDKAEHFDYWELEPYLTVDEELANLLSKDKVNIKDKNFAEVYNRYINTNSFKDKGICALDASTVLSHRVNVEVISEK